MFLRDMEFSEDLLQIEILQPSEEDLNGHAPESEDLQLSEEDLNGHAPPDSEERVPLSRRIPN